eukprot:1916201-Prymnesium_polylepis.1
MQYHHGLRTGLVLSTGFAEIIQNEQVSFKDNDGDTSTLILTAGGLHWQYSWYSLSTGTRQESVPVRSLELRGDNIRAPGHRHLVANIVHPPAGLLRDSMLRSLVQLAKRANVQLTGFEGYRDRGSMSQEQKTLLLWHGTSWEIAARICANGFEMSPTGLLGPGVYVARFDKASSFAENCPRHGGDEGAIVKVRITYTNAKMVHGDYNGWQQEGYDACRAERTSMSSHMEWCLKTPAQVEVLEVKKLACCSVVPESEAPSTSVNTQRADPELELKSSLEALQRELIVARQNEEATQRQLATLKTEKDKAVQGSIIVMDAAKTAVKDAISKEHARLGLFAYDPSCTYPAEDVIKLSKLVSRNLEDRPNAVDPNRFYNNVKAIYDRSVYPGVSHEHILDMRMLLATCAASTWFSQKQHGNLTGWLQALMDHY